MAETLKPPIFLLGNVRSGTSMMQEYFGFLPDIVTWYEPRTIWVYAAPWRKHDEFIEKDARPGVCRYIRRRFLKYQHEHGGKQIMEKTPSNLLRIPYVRSIFPRSKYVYLIRHPYSQLSSSELKWRVPIGLGHAWDRLKETPTWHIPLYAKRFLWDHFRRRILRKQHVSVWGVRYPGIYEDLRVLSTEEVIAKQWAYCSQHVEEQLKEMPSDSVVRMRYEDFVMSPVKSFYRLAEHFDLQVPSFVADVVAEQTDTSRQHKWKRLAPEIIERVTPILSKEMERHGYTLDGKALGASVESD